MGGLAPSTSRVSTGEGKEVGGLAVRKGEGVRARNAPQSEDANTYPGAPAALPRPPTGRTTAAAPPLGPLFWAPKVVLTVLLWVSGRR